MNSPLPSEASSERDFAIPAKWEDEWQLFKSRAAHDKRLSTWKDERLRVIFLRLKFEDECGES